MAASTNPWLLLLLVLLALNFARIVSESLILDHQSLEDDEFDPIELELEEDFWASDNSIPNISPDCESPCLVNACSDEEGQVTALLPSVAFSMLKLYSSNISRAFSCRRCPYLARSVTEEDVYY
ncbi:hypothetical protein Peur_044505 [Populus x canadensis]